MEGILLTAGCLLACIMYYTLVFVPNQKLKNELKIANGPKYAPDAQDDDYCHIAAAISKCKTPQQFNDCIKAVKQFQDKYGKTFIGQQNVSSLIDQYEAREQKILLQFA